MMCRAHRSACWRARAETVETVETVEPLERLWNAPQWRPDRREREPWGLDGASDGRWNRRRPRMGMDTPPAQRTEPLTSMSGRRVATQLPLMRTHSR